MSSYQSKKAVKRYCIVAFVCEKTANLLRMTGVELAAACSQTRHPTSPDAPGHKTEKMFQMCSAMRLKTASNYFRVKYQRTEVVFAILGR